MASVCVATTVSVISKDTYNYWYSIYRHNIFLKAVSYTKVVHCVHINLDIYTRLHKKDLSFSLNKDRFYKKRSSRFWYHSVGIIFIFVTSTSHRNKWYHWNIVNDS